jgi:hypothetical protein
MKLTKEQIEFLNKVCDDNKWTLNYNNEVDVDGDVDMSSLNLTEIPVRFGVVNGTFYCHTNNLTTLKNSPTSVSQSFACYSNNLTTLEVAPVSVGGYFDCYNNNLTEYFKSIKEEDFLLWDNFFWIYILKEYPFLIEIGKKYVGDNLNHILNKFPQTKIYI